jgi:hypothetical protein
MFQKTANDAVARQSHDVSNVQETPPTSAIHCCHLLNGDITNERSSAQSAAAAAASKQADVSSQVLCIVTQVFPQPATDLLLNLQC